MFYFFYHFRFVIENKKTIRLLFIMKFQWTRCNFKNLLLPTVNLQFDNPECFDNQNVLVLATIPPSLPPYPTRFPSPIKSHCIAFPTTTKNPNGCVARRSRQYHIIQHPTINHDVTDRWPTIKMRMNRLNYWEKMPAYGPANQDKI